MSTADPNRVIVTGENPFIRLSVKDGDPNSTDASFWRILFSPSGPGHVLYLKSELTEGLWRIYSDNIAMARWLQSTVQGMLNPETQGSYDPGDRCRIQQIGRSALFLDRARGVDRRGGAAHLARYRRSAADPHPAQRRAQSASLWRVHRPGPGVGARSR